MRKRKTATLTIILLALIPALPAVFAAPAIPTRSTKTSSRSLCSTGSGPCGSCGHHAAEWGIDPDKLGVAGYSAGANLAMMLAGHFDEGDPQAQDPVERESSRPAFVVGGATWHWRETRSPFSFREDTPPVLLVHATNDGLPGPEGKIGGAPIQLPYEIRDQLRTLGVPVEMAVFEEGGHGVGNLIPARYRNGFPGAQWPKRLVKWIESLPGD